MLCRLRVDLGTKAVPTSQDSHDHTKHDLQPRQKGEVYSTFLYKYTAPG